MTPPKDSTFDPYRKWLGIPESQRPPTLYQLLGLAQGETDAEVVEEAAIRQTTHLRAYQVGPNAEDCTRILNEISQAKQVLLSPQKRAAYDQKLAELAARKAAIQAKAAGSSKGSGSDSAFSDLETAASVVPAKERRDSRKPVGRRKAKKESKGIPPRILLAVAGCGILIVSLIALAVAMRPSTVPSAAQARTQTPPPDPVQKIPVVPANPAVEPKPSVEVKTPTPTPPPVEPNPIEAKLPIEPKPPEPGPVVKTPEPQALPKEMTVEYVGFWHWPPNAPANKLTMDMTIENRGGILSAKLICRTEQTSGNAHVNFDFVAGKFSGAVVRDTELPNYWKDLKSISLDRPVSGKMLAVYRSSGPTGSGNVNFGFGRVANAQSSPPIPVQAAKAAERPKFARVDLPDEAKLKDVEAAVRENFKTEYAKKAPADRIALAEKLLDLAADTKDDPAARYVLYCEARDLAAAAGRWSIVADAFEQLDAGFKVDLLPQREAALQAFVKSGLTKETAVEATEAALEGVGDAVVADKLPLASGFIALATTASSKSLSVPHINLVRKAEAELKFVSTESDAVTKARESLKTMPDDPAANLAVGRFDALRRHEWQSAIALLAKGGDGELPALARKEIAAPGDGPGRQKLADEWWALAEKEKDSSWIRIALQNRAAHWYRLASSNVTGLSLTLVHERLKTIDEAPSPFRLGSSSGGTELKAMRGHKGAVTSLFLAPDGKRLFSGSLDGTVKSWDLKLAKNLTNYQATQPVYAIAFSPSGRYLALGFKDTMKVINADNPTATGRLPTGSAWPGSYWPSDDRVFTVSGISVASHSVPTGGSGSSPNTMRASAIVWSQTYTKLITIGEETWICNTFREGFVSQKLKTSIADSTSAAFAPTQPIAAIGTADKKIQIVDLQTRNVTTTLEGTPTVARCLAYLPTGDRLLSGGDDGNIRIWDVATGKEVRRFASGSKGITSLMVSSDGKQIVTGGIDGVIRTWALPRDKNAKVAASE